MVAATVTVVTDLSLTRQFATQKLWPHHIGRENDFTRKKGLKFEKKYLRPHRDRVWGFGYDVGD